MSRAGAASVSCRIAVLVWRTDSAVSSEDSTIWRTPSAIWLAPSAWAVMPSRTESKRGARAWVTSINSSRLEATLSTRPAPWRMSSVKPSMPITAVETADCISLTICSMPAEAFAV